MVWMIVGIILAIIGFVGMLITVPLLEKFRPTYTHDEIMKIAVRIKTALMVLVTAGCVLAVIFAGK